MDTWREKAAALAAELTTTGELTEDWRAAFEAVPRHVFLPGVQMEEAYGTDAVVTQNRTAQIAGGGDVELATSSASAPGVVAVMLDRLSVHKGHRVLEIGTGTGYNAALLSFQLGYTNVYSVELDPDLIGEARHALAEVGFTPELACGDGYQGMPEAGPFDRIIATCAIEHVPPAWIDQLAGGGRIVAPLSGNGCGLLVLDKTAPDEVTGRFDPYLVGFMPLRDEVDNPLPSRFPWGVAGGPMSQDGTTTLDPVIIREADPDLLLWLQLHLPGMRIGGLEREDGKRAVTLARTGAEAVTSLEVAEPGRWEVRQRGTSRPWDTAEHAHALWLHLGKPGRERFGISALNDPHRQYVWIDDPGSRYSWPMMWH
jgi:protein-L-isoaspartate(D-aspartate) O-methyltransferase